jgi:hypothetical protein
MHERPQHTPARRAAALAAATAAVIVTMLVLDLTWLVVLAKGFYDTALASLKSAEILDAEGSDLAHEMGYGGKRKTLGDPGQVGALG